MPSNKHFNTLKCISVHCVAFSMHLHVFEYSGAKPPERDVAQLLGHGADIAAGLYAPWGVEVAHD